MEPRRLLIVAGEQSGDSHGARLLEALREQAPGLEVFGLAGDQLRAQGVEAVADSTEISVVGLTEVLKILPRVRQIFAALLAEVDRRRPATALLIDSPGFNLRLARELKRRGVRVIYYVSPQVWAWWRSRVRSIARRVDKMLVLFPFEVDFYRDADVDVRLVGHPLVDEVPSPPHVWDRRGGDEPLNIALMPGSRVSEVEVLLPILLESARRIARDFDVRLRLVRARGAAGRVAEGFLAEAEEEIEVVGADERYAALADTHLALCASGTATLELGLVGTPMLVVYRVSFWTAWAGRLLVRLPFYSLVNLVLGERVVPELMQAVANPERIRGEAAALLGDRGRIDGMRRRLAELRGRLGSGGASRRAAAEVAEVLRTGGLT